MGIEYYIINRKNKTAYDLGKGGWYALSYDKECFQDLEYLENYILEECYNEVNDFIKTYVKEKVAPDLFEFCKNTEPKDIFIFNDSGDDMYICRCIGYRFLGHRYSGMSNQEYQEHLKFLNRHLDNNTPAHFYDINRAKGYGLEPLMEQYK